MSHLDGGLPGAQALETLLNELRGPQSLTVRKFFARELTNHMFLKATSPGFSGELDERDVTVILHRLGLVLHTIRLSAPGPEDYAPRQNGHGDRMSEASLHAVEEALKA